MIEDRCESTPHPREPYLGMYYGSWNSLALGHLLDPSPLFAWPTPQLAEFEFQPFQLTSPWKLDESDLQNHSENNRSLNANHHLHQLLVMEQTRSELDALSSGRRIYLGAIIFLDQSWTPLFFDEAKSEIKATCLTMRSLTISQPSSGRMDSMSWNTSISRLTQSAPETRDTVSSTLMTVKLLTELFPA